MNAPTEWSATPLLDSLLCQKGMKPMGIYSVRDAAKLFGVTSRTIQDWIRDGKMPARDLPGHGRFLVEDLEAFLRSRLRTNSN
jgi:excisionase family DNA binding protein